MTGLDDQGLSQLLQKICGMSQEQFAAENPKEPLDCEFTYLVFRNGEKIRVDREQLTLGEIRTLGDLFEQEQAALKNVLTNNIQKFILQKFEPTQ